MNFPTDLKHFGATEFQHPEKMNVPFLRWLDRVREVAGVPMTLTDDARVDGDPEPLGSAKGKSLHHRGCAVDIRTRTLDANQKWKIAHAVHLLSASTPDGWKVELESVYTTGGDCHWHIGLDWAVGKDHELIEQDD